MIVGWDLPGSSHRSFCFHLILILNNLSISNVYFGTEYIPAHDRFNIVNYKPGKCLL